MQDGDMSTTTMAETFPPGDFIRDELDARGWTQADLAAIMGRPLRSLNEIIAAKKTITPETAVGLGNAFGTSAEIWMNLESAYRLSLVKNDDEEVARKAKIFGIAPVNEMAKREWIAPYETVQELETHVLAFYQIKSLDEKPIMSFAARKSTSYADVTPAQLAWFYRAKHLAAVVTAQQYSKDKLAKAIKELKSLIEHVEGVRHVPKILSDAGVRFIVVEHLAGSKIDGAAFWLSKKEPVIALSIRYDRIDGFWHTLGHELGHIHNEDDFSIDTDLIGEDSERRKEKPEIEIKADEFAERLTIPKDRLDDFIIRTRPLYAKKRIMGFAKVIHVHPGIVVGQLQHRKEISYSHGREMLEKVRGLIIDAALTDGWGQKVRI
jgi:HTH-type transcriptional regulator/antitoxin HigA